MAKSKSKEQSPIIYKGRALTRQQKKQLFKAGIVIPEVELRRIELLEKIDEIEDKLMDLSERYR